MQAPLVSTVILNYRNAELTLACVDHVARSAQVAGFPVEIIIVDNSAATTIATLRTSLPEGVILIGNEQNVGFAKANNQGIRVSRAPYVLLLNNDAFLNPTCLSQGIAFLQSNERVGIWSPQLVGSDGTFQVTCARFPTLRSIAGEYLLPIPYSGSRYARDLGIPTAVDMVIGAAMLIRRDVFERIGYLDETFFFTGEDIDFCKRAIDAGYAVFLDPTCTMVHLGSTSQTDSTWLDSPYLHKARIQYFHKHSSHLMVWAVTAIIKSGLFLRRLKIRFTRRKPVPTSHP